MKKMLLVVALGVAGLVSANSSNANLGNKVENGNKVTSISSEKEEDAGSCSWCVYVNGSMHCGEAATCSDAKKIAHQMAIDAQK